MNWAEGNTNVETALKNVAIDSVGKFAGAGVGAKLVLLYCHLLEL